MRCRSLILTLVLITVVVAYTFQALSWVATAQTTETVTYSFGKIKACYGIVRYPTWGLAEPVLQGGTLVVMFWPKAPSITGIVLTNGTLTYTLKPKAVQGKSEVIAEVPKSVKPGLYDMIVQTSNGECGEHNAVWVLSKYPKTIILMHETDNHFGVINPNGRTAMSYDLAAILLALSMPNLTLVVDTGDLGNTGSIGQYLKAALVYGLLNKPTFTIPGNHDHVSKIINYEDYVGLRNWSISLGKFLFVGIDSGYYGYITNNEADWAYNVLMHSKATAKIVMFHHPLFAYVYGSTPHSFKVSSWEDLLKILESKKPGSKYTYIYSSWLQNKKGLETLVKAIYESNATLVLTGHIHLDSYAVITRPNGVKTWFVTTTALGGPVRRKDYHGFRIIEVGYNGSVKVYGQNVPWDRHASYSVEGVKVSLDISKAASAEALTITDKKIISLLPHIVLAVPVPTYMQGSYKVFAPGFSKVWKRCTPVYCAVYAETNKVALNKTYRLVAYVKPDKEPPTIKIVDAPKYVQPGTPVTITYSVSDDSWGVASTSALVTINGKTEHMTPMLYGGAYMLSFAAPKATGKIVVKIIATDFSGKVSTKTLTIPVTTATSTTTSRTTTTATKTSPVKTTTTTTSVTKTTTTMTTAVKTTTYTYTVPPVTITKPTVSIPSVSLPPTTISVPPSPSTAPPPAILVGGAIAIAITIILIVLASRSRK